MNIGDINLQSAVLWREKYGTYDLSNVWREKSALY